MQQSAERKEKEIIIQKLKKRGLRITKQRLMLLDIILEEECSCCKEVYYKAVKQEPKIGTATVYRMINTLEEIGAISRKNMYKIACPMNAGEEGACTIELDDGSILQLSERNWNQIIQIGLNACGYIEDRKVQSVKMKSCGCESR